MTLLDDSVKQGLLAGALKQGLEQLDLNQEVKFQVYSRVVLPIDGYVFWSPLNTVCFKGSLHFSQEIQQSQDETVGYATVTFTSENEIAEFSAAPTDTIYVAWHEGFRFAFTGQQGFYKQADVWHYVGNSVYPALTSQLLDRPGAIDPKQAVTSNSLALWLALNSYRSIYYDGFSNKVVLYPSYLVSPNMVPPYGVVHIGPEDTRALQAVPYLDRNRNHYQLAADRVRITLYGLQNNAALDFMDCVNQYSVDTGNFGVMSMEIMKDGKRTEPSLEALAMQKFLDYEVSYNQARVAAVSRQLILSAMPTYVIEGPVPIPVS